MRWNGHTAACPEWTNSSLLHRIRSVSRWPVWFVLISWPVNYLGWILQTNSTGLGPIAVWGDAAGSSNATPWTVPIVNLVRPLEFFRLRRP